MAIDSNGKNYENRTLQFYGLAYGDSNVSLTATINGETVFSGEVPTINSPMPTPPIDLPSILFSLENSVLFPTNWQGSLPMSITVTGGNVSVSVSPTGTPLPIYNAYRLVGSGTTTATGIINWSIAGMFTDFSAMRVGFNALDANGGIGQMQIQGPTNYTISGGQYVDNDATASGVWEYAGPNSPYAATNNNADYYG